MLKFFTKQTGSNTRRLVFCAAAMALSFVTSNLKLWYMPMGGSVTLLSMFFISLTGYWFGLKAGLLTAVSYGLLQLILDPYILSLPQLLLDYIFAFGALGLSGFFANKKNGMYKGYILSVLGRFAFTFLSGVVFFGAYAADYGMSAPVYSFCYNGAYIFAEAILTLIVIALPPVKNALNRLKALVD